MFVTYRVIFFIHCRVLFSFHNHLKLALNSFLVLLFSQHYLASSFNFDNSPISHSWCQGGPVLNSSNLDMATWGAQLTRSQPEHRQQRRGKPALGWAQILHVQYTPSHKTTRKWQPLKGVNLYIWSNHDLSVTVYQRRSRRIKTLSHSRVTLMVRQHLTFLLSADAECEVWRPDSRQDVLGRGRRRECSPWQRCRYWR